MAIAPHGGTLVNRILAGPELDAAKKRAAGLKKIQVDAYLAFDIDCIGKGIFSPLTGFMNRAQVQRVCDEMLLADGVAWSIPITLHVHEDVATGLKEGEDVAIEDDRGDLVAILSLTEKFTFDHEELAKKVYGTVDKQHPGVAYLGSHAPVYLAGDIAVLKAREVEHQEYNLTPEQTRAEFDKRGWKRIAAFQTRNPIHRAHEYLTKCALEMCNGILIHPLMGTTKSDDIPGDVRMDCYKALIEKYYAPKHTMLSIMPVNMRYAGPKEAIMHAIIRQNYGCTHFIVGRDHAGVGNFYGTYDAHDIFDKLPAGALKITPIFFDHSFYCRACGNMASVKTCPHNQDQHVQLSGTKVRDMLKAGERPPEEFSRHEVADILIKWAQSV